MSPEIACSTAPLDSREHHGLVTSSGDSEAKQHPLRPGGTGRQRGAGALCGLLRPFLEGRPVRALSPSVVCH